MRSLPWPFVNTAFTLPSAELLTQDLAMTSAFERAVFRNVRAACVWRFQKPLKQRLGINPNFRAEGRRLHVLRS